MSLGATEIKNGDVVTLGNLTFTVQIISRPQSEPTPSPLPIPLEASAPELPDSAQGIKEEHPHQPRLSPIPWLTAASLKKWLQQD